MKTDSNKEYQDIIDQVEAIIKKKITNHKQASLISDFARRYFLSTSIEDLNRYSINDLYAILVSHWNFISQRNPTEAKIRVFNPDLKKDGWESRHTVIQLSYNDIPFLVDSTRMAINNYNYQIHLIIHFGGFKVKRDDENRITEILPPRAIEENARSEAPIYIEIDRITSKSEMDELKEDISRALGDVCAAVADWRKMFSRVEDCLKELEANPPSLDLSELAESRDFLRWLINNNFTFLGARDYKLIGNGTNRALQVIPGSGLGVLRDESSLVTSKSYSALPPQARKMALSKDILIIAKTNTMSTVHREVFTDYIGVKRFNEHGELIGERRFIGLYTSTAYHSSPRHIPFLRHKVDKVLKDLGFPPDSHDGKEAVHILETLPRDDLFQASHEELYHLTLAIIHLKERKNIRLLVRRDAFYRYFSCLVYVPRETFTTDLALAMQEILMTEFKGHECSFTTYFSDSILARIHFLVRVNPKAQIEYQVSDIERKLIDVSRSWSDRLKDELLNQFDEYKALRIYQQYRKAFPAGYMEYISPADAVKDIVKLETLSTDKTLRMQLSKHGDSSRIGMKLYHAEDTIVLSDVLPILENMGLRVIGERPHEIKLRDGSVFWINNFNLLYAGNKAIDIHDVSDIFQDAFARIWFAETENDGFNRLILEANLTWQEATMLRAYTQYLRQIGFTFSQKYIEQALINNIEMTNALVQLFILRFDPSYQTSGRSDPHDLIKYIEKTLDEVVSLDEDRILRKLFEVIQATIRTNYFQTDGDGKSKSYLSFKFNPSIISDLPLPRPMFEIFVYSPQVEGIHLRAGKVARGGLRWSDRREDFRTEVLGLMKAQQVKNTVIVPQGAKGGFVVKKLQTPNMTREDYLKQGIACYSTFISGLLDITDNIINGKVVPPANVVRYDDDDPYLVVAADKGTASFSDIANGIAAKYQFWLDDAFASGGSAGYDHKKMGITSRGAWVSVERHFRELGLNPEKEDFTVVGIGDMQGDVFGNGLLRSRHIKLLAAYNHMHIFLDPNPDAEKSFQERERLFKLPQSSWKDYNTSIISAGGGVFDRSAKSIKISPEVKHALHIKKDSLSPNELIRAILMAPVELLWNGGIGTFAKATTESHLDVGDKNNDAIRVNAPELGAKVIAEGGNLGMTQLSRIEYSLHGGIVNTDFIDNSAGVDCSDHEVNIKILLNQIVSLEKMTRSQRDKLLEKMTDEVAALVLKDNYSQNLMLSLEASVSHQTMDIFKQYMNDLEKEGRLNRHLEFLPDDAVLTERKANNQPLTRPETAMLMAYSKMFLKQDLLNTNIPEDKNFDQYLISAFPEPLQEKYLSQIKHHSLRREIISTQLAKAISDRMGINFVERLQRETGASLDFIVRAYFVTINVFDLEKLWAEILDLDYKVDPQIQYRMILQLYHLIRRSTRWFLRNRKPNMDIQHAIVDFSPAISELTKSLPQLLDKAGKEAFDITVNYLKENKVTDSLSNRIACCNALFTSLDIAEAAKKYNLGLTDTAKTYYLLGDKLELNWLRQVIGDYTVDNVWDELARSGFRDDLDRAQRKLCMRILSMKAKEAENKNIDEKINNWINRYQFLIDRWQMLLSELKSSETQGFVTFSVVLRELFDFAQAA